MIPTSVIFYDLDMFMQRLDSEISALHRFLFGSRFFKDGEYIVEVIKVGTRSQVVSPDIERKDPGLNKGLTASRQLKLFI